MQSAFLKVKTSGATLTVYCPVFLKHLNGSNLLKGKIHTVLVKKKKKINQNTLLKSAGID